MHFTELSFSVLYLNFLKNLKIKKLCKFFLLEIDQSKIFRAQLIITNRKTLCLKQIKCVVKQ